MNRNFSKQKKILLPKRSKQAVGFEAEEFNHKRILNSCPKCVFIITQEGKDESF